MNRRKRRRAGRRSRRNKGYVTGIAEKKGSISTFVVVICLSIAAGYMAAVYIICPILGLDASPLSISSISNEKKETDEKSKAPVDTANNDLEPDDTEGLAESGYVLQYGSFSSREAADNRVVELRKSGIEAEVLEKDGAFKVISPLFDTEQEARVKMETQRNLVDVFITQIP